MLVHPGKEACVVTQRDGLNVLPSHDPRAIKVVLGEREAIEYAREHTFARTPS